MKQSKLPAGLRWRGPVLWIDIHHEGQRVRESTATGDVKVAAARLMKLRVELNEGTRQATKSAGVGSGEYTVARGFDRAIEGAWLIDSGEDTKRQARSNMIMLDKSGYLPFRTPVSALDRHALQKLQRDLMDSGISNGTVNLRFWVVRAVLEQALADGAISTLPTFPKALSVRGNSRQRYITAEEESKMLDHLAANPRWADLHDLWVIVLDTGLRIFEASRLNRSTFENGRIVIPADWAKNGKARAVPATARVRAILERRLSVSADVFPVPGKSVNTRYWPTKFNEQWQVAREQIGMPDVVIHTGRHTLATRLFEVGTDVRTAMSWLGHSSPNITMAYAKATDEATRSALDRLENFAKGIGKVAEVKLSQQ